MLTTRLAVLGAGSYGTALALTLARNGHSVALWCHDKARLSRMQQQRCNAKYLPDIHFPTELKLVADLADIVASHRDILVVVPSDGFAELLRQMRSYLRSDARIVWATKGLEFETGRLLHEVAQDILGETYPLAVMSGPTFAKELARGLPTAIAIASLNTDFLYDLQKIFHCDQSFRVYRNNDMVGVQIGGAVKNVIAIGVGISDGMGFGANARTALITRGLAEITRLGMAMGAHLETFSGMAGLGDLVLTCTDDQSRNRRFGLLLGQGASVNTAIAEIKQVVEGYHTTQAVVTLAKKLMVDMPITEQIYQILYCGKAARQAASDLLNRMSTHET